MMTVEGPADWIGASIAPGSSGEMAASELSSWKTAITAGTWKVRLLELSLTATLVWKVIHL